VLLTGAAGDLMLGGTLQVLAPPSFRDFGDYLIFDLSGGTITGAFASYVLGTLDNGKPLGAYALVAGGDVYLHLSYAPEPGAVCLALLGALALGVRRSR